jgi:hypothetical protein
VRYALSPYIKQIRFVFKGLKYVQCVMSLTKDSVATSSGRQNMYPCLTTHTHTHNHCTISGRSNMFYTICVSSKCTTYGKIIERFIYGFG